MDVKGAVWRKSTRSGDNGGDCVELAALGGEVGVRDSKAPSAGHLTLARADLAVLIERIKSGAL
ncbi:DUF397 domain-containing protein [Actinomadura craniellae]|uniref:DUF397 domain-containing protein n=1 Tax=Actinomadura craniellae TaxID=2231787 RepID=A0A365H297_9ACTN|nr:DUF397 domain-containing protein [Actinomadura craniellae]RAY13221.1 DUF397 domain-containing protein [Actinomadura craniellae]